MNTGFGLMNDFNFERRVLVLNIALNHAGIYDELLNVKIMIVFRMIIFFIKNVDFIFFFGMNILFIRGKITFLSLEVVD